MIETSTAVVAALTALLVAVTALLGAGSAMLVVVFRLRSQLLEFRRIAKRRDDATDRDVESIAESMLRRGRLEAQRNGLITETKEKDVSTVVRNDVVEAYKPILPTLQQIRDANPGITRARFALLVEQQFGSWLVKHICRVYNVEDHACWDIAAELVLGPDVQAAPC